MVMLFGHPKPVLAVVIESQLGIDDAKLYSWPVYLTVLRSRFRCDAVLMVVALDETVGRWASRPIDLGNGGRVVPLVVGPGSVPHVTDIEIARRHPGLALFSVLLYGKDAHAEEMVPAAMEAIAQLDAESTLYYLELVYAAFNEAAQRALIATMPIPQNYQFKFPPLREAQERGKAEGKAEGEVKAERSILVMQLEQRFGPLPAHTRELIDRAGAGPLSVWLGRVLSASSLEDVFTSEE
jgi:hypothetical protein